MKSLVPCTQGSARGQMAEAMREAGIEIGSPASQVLHEVTDPWNYDLELNEADTAGPALPGPGAGSLERWREVRDQVRDRTSQVVEILAAFHGVGGPALPPENAEPAGRATASGSRRGEPAHCAAAASTIP